MVAEKKWTRMSKDEKIETLHEEVKRTEGYTRSLRKIVVDLARKVNDIRRFMGMRRSA